MLFRFGDEAELLLNLTSQSPTSLANIIRTELDQAQSDNSNLLLGLKETCEKIFKNSDSEGRHQLLISVVTQSANVESVCDEIVKEYISANIITLFIYIGDAYAEFLSNLDEFHCLRDLNYFVQFIGSFTIQEMVTLNLLEQMLVEEFIACDPDTKVTSFDGSYSKSSTITLNG